MQGKTKNAKPLRTVIYFGSETTMSRQRIF